MGRRRVGVFMVLWGKVGEKKKHNKKKKPPPALCLLSRAHNSETPSTSGLITGNILRGYCNQSSLPTARPCLGSCWPRPSAMAKSLGTSVDWWPERGNQVTRSLPSEKDKIALAKQPLPLSLSLPLSFFPSHLFPTLFYSFLSLI